MFICDADTEVITNDLIKWGIRLDPGTFVKMCIKKINESRILKTDARMLNCVVI